ncbi:MAG: YebC/PmpR family DNA-binding transcriptional regulator [Desulfuromonadaceae bacterium]|nr:YebC/PmpR family DNA-binding transcriptional regulator [Desulfuromonadaceae bacterium]
MSGHSKWSNIKHRKGAQDAKRGKVFTKLLKEVTIAARNGSDPASNFRLRIAVDKAKSENVPKDTIERAIKKGAGELDGAAYEEGTFEGYGPGGVAILVEFMTDNRTRTVADVRHIFSKHNGNLGVTGSVSFLFDRKGVISFSDDEDFDAIFEAALEAGAEDVRSDEDAIEVVTAPDDFIEVREALAGKGLTWETAEVTMIPQTTVNLEGKQAEQMLKLMEKLEDYDDVQNVYANFDIAEEDLEQMMG